MQFAGLIRALVLAALLAVAGGQDAPPYSPPRYGEPDLHKDFKIFRQVLEVGHPGIYRYSAKSTMDGMFEAAERSLKAEQNVLDFYRQLLPIVASIRCGHTYVELPSQVQDELFAVERTLPLDIVAIDGKVYVSRDYASPDGSLVGAELRTINGQPVGFILRKLLAVMSGDGWADNGRLWRLSRPGVWSEYLSTYLGMAAPFDVVYRRETAATDERITFKGMTWPEVKSISDARPQEKSGNAQLSFYDGGRVAVLTVRRFIGHADVEKKMPLEIYFAEAFRRIAHQRSEALIIDWRDNNGGQDELGVLLLSYLVDRPFRYYRDLVLSTRDFPFSQYLKYVPKIAPDAVERRPDGRFLWSSHPAWGMQQPRAPQSISEYSSFRTAEHSLRVVSLLQRSEP